MWAEEATQLGSVLTGRRRVRRNADGAWAIERTPAPVRHHPLMLYAMGKLPPEEVPELTLFENQADNVSDPEPGTAVTGGHRSVTVFAAIGAYGPRAGPSPNVWRRATVIVSRDGLLSQRALDYWTFFAQRLEDPQKSGVISYDGYPSFDVAAWNTIDLQTAIRPKAFPGIVQALPVDAPSFGSADWRGVVFDTPVPSQYTAASAYGSPVASPRVTDRTSIPCSFDSGSMGERTAMRSGCGTASVPGAASISTSNSATGSRGATAWKCFSSGPTALLSTLAAS